MPEVSIIIPVYNKAEYLEKNGQITIKKLHIGYRTDSCR